MYNFEYLVENINMINGYEIKKINNEEILYLYLDIDKEFGRIKSKKQALNKEINEYLRNNNIDFKGKTIAIVASGLVIGSLMFNKPVNKYDIGKLDNYVISLNLDEDIISSSNVLEEIKEEKTSSNVVVENNDIKEEKINNSKNNVSNTSIKKESTVNNSNVVKTEENQEDEKIVNEVKDDKDNKTYVTIKRSSGLITSIELEEYVIGVVGAEMPASFNVEALKAQAIIARTYAINTLNKGKILTDNSSTQNYKDNNELKKMWGNSYNTYYQKIQSAVSSTNGMYLTYNGSIIDAVYHSTSNGKTEDSVYVWGNEKPYLKSVDSSYDIINKSFNYEVFLAYSEISNKLNMEINQNSNIEILSYTTSGRVEKISINEKIYSGVELRTLLRLRSTDFEIIKEDNGVSIKTKGYGHGVGLSQYGANGMANNGYSYEKILKHYYTGVNITHL